MCHATKSYCSLYVSFSNLNLFCKNTKIVCSNNSTPINCYCIPSLVGYLVGLGDRHIQNILIDQNTAELIHIDFGMSVSVIHLKTIKLFPFYSTF